MSTTTRILARAAAVLAPLAFATAAAAALAAGTAIVDDPTKLVFKPLKYDAPDRKDFRHVLSNGVVVFVVEDPGLPLVYLTIAARGGDDLDPPGKAGLSAITADQMRSGGAGDLDADKFDEELDFLALDMSITSDQTETYASIDLLSKDLDRGLDLLVDALRKPRFQQDRIDLYKTRVQQALEHRNDATPSIENREWKRLVYGTDHFESRLPTTSSLKAITRDDMVAFQQRLWNPSNLIVGVAGAVKPADVVARLEKRFASWPKGDASPKPPKPSHVPKKGVWIVDKPDVNQTRVSLGHLGSTWNDPRAPAIDVMVDVLGGAGFTSYIMRRVRSDEGLAYSAGAVYGLGREYPKSFRTLFQSRNAAVARALSVTVDQIERIRDTEASAEDLETTKNGIIGAFPLRFNSARAKVGVFIADELIDRPSDWWTRYRPAIQGVTAADVQKVAKEVLHPDSLTVLVVGNASEILAGDPDHPEFDVRALAGPEGVLQIPLPDPGTMVYPHDPRPIAPAKAPSGS